MKKVLSFIVLSVLTMTGCASKEAYKDYVDALKSAQAQYLAAAEKPMVDFAGNCTGPISLNVRQPIQPMQVQQIKDSEWVPFATAVVGGLTNIGSQWLGYELFGKKGNTTSGNTTTVQNATFNGNALIGVDGNTAWADLKTGTSANGGFNFTGTSMPTTTTTSTSTNTTATK